MHKWLILPAAFLLLSACQKQNSFTDEVNVFVGTGFHGHTFPGATLPHGMVQLSPDTRITTWDGCSGYHYSDRSIMGFSHIHYSGTGAGGGADIMFMPTVGPIQMNAGDTSDTKSGYRAAFSHADEFAEPGYYSVRLEDDIRVELTSTARVGFHRYNFGNSSKGNVILDLVHGINDHIDSLYLEVISDRKIAGFRHSYGGLDGDRTIWFVAEFSSPVVSYGIYSNDRELAGTKAAGGKNIKAHFTFDTQKEKAIMVKVALSRVDQEGAQKNLTAEVPGWDFQSVRNKAKKIWNHELSRIEIKGGSNAERRTFYSAMYHALIHPNISSDVDRRYRSADKKVYTARDFDNYTTFSLWDTHRALHPLYTIIDQKKTNQFIRSFLERYEHFGNLPIMEFGGSEGFAMIGYHSLPVIADAWRKGIRDYDQKLAFEAMKKLSEGYRTGKAIYKQIGFIPYDSENQSVSKTLEYAYDDWCVSVLAQELGKGDYNLYAQKGQFYRNLYNPATGFMQPRGSNYEWFGKFDPMEPEHNYTEGNAYQYTLFVPHDLNGLITLMGGDEKFEAWLDTCFSRKNNPSKMSIPDVTGLIGQYAHGNEPSHHMAYLYNFVGKPWKTQEKVNQILTTLYSDKPDGLCGNEDAGQMSAWYLLSSMGFYPVTPGLDYYVIGSPLFDEAILHLENGKKFVIRIIKKGTKNIYIQGINLDGKGYSRSYLLHRDIMNGGVMEFVMGDTPDKSWASEVTNRPVTEKYAFAGIPQIHASSNTFEQNLKVKLLTDDIATVIRYTTDGSAPTSGSEVYRNPIDLTRSTVITARGFSEGKEASYPVYMNFTQMNPWPAAKVVNPEPGLKYEYHETYFLSVADLQRAKPEKSGIINTVNIDAVKDDRAFGYQFYGYISVPVTGVYNFYIQSNDGSILYIDDNPLVDNDGSHGTQEKFSSVALAKGLHPLKVSYFQMGGGKSLKLSWEKPGKPKEEVPASALFH